MSNALLHTVALCHAVLLVAGAALGVRHYAGTLGHKLAAAFLLIWGNLILTGLGLSLLGQLGHLRWYLLLSCILALFTAALSWFLFGGRTAPVAGEGPRPEDAPLRPTPLVLFALTALGLALAASLIVAAVDYPMNADTLAYRFPRPYLYLTQGHLGQPGSDIDFRINHYPLNAPLGYLFLAVYGLDARFFTLPSILCWVVAGIGVGLLARGIGASRKGALVAVTVYLLTPVVLVCATSGNDEVIAAAPLLLGVVFLQRWWHTASRADAWLGGLGLGIGAGTKLHWMFFVAYVPLVLLALTWNLVRSGHFFIFLRRRAAQLAVIALLTVGLSCPFLVANRRGSGHLINPPDVLTPLVNQPFRFRPALITAEIYTAQLFLSPFPDLLISGDAATVARSYDRFNALLTPAFAWFDTSDGYSAPWYHFRGVALPDVPARYSEISLWLGFSPYLMLLAVGCFCWARRNRAALLASWLALGFFAWHLVNVLVMHYVETEGLYYSYPLTLAVAGLAVLWDLGARWRPLRLAFVAVLVCHVLVAINIFACSHIRSLTDIVRGHFVPRSVRVDPEAAKILGSARAIDIVYTEWELQAFDLIQLNPRSRYRIVSPTATPRPGALRVFCLPASSSGGFVELPFPGRAAARLAPLGTIDTPGREMLFAERDSLPEREQPELGYIALKVTPIAVRDERWQEAVRFEPLVYGLGANEAIELRVEQVFPDDAQNLIADWQSPGLLMDRPLPIAPCLDESQLRISIRSATEPRTTASTFLPLANDRVLDPLAPELYHLHGPAAVSVSHLGRANSVGFQSVEGPYPPTLPHRVRWMNAAQARICFQVEDAQAGEFVLHFRAIRYTDRLVVRVNGQDVLHASGPIVWNMREYRTAAVPLHTGENVLEFEAGNGGANNDSAALRVLFEELSLEPAKSGPMTRAMAP